LHRIIISYFNAARFLFDDEVAGRYVSKYNMPDCYDDYEVLTLDFPRNDDCVVTQVIAVIQGIEAD